MRGWVNKQPIIIPYLFFLFFLLAVIPNAFSDQINYFYDDTGQLTRAVKSSEGVIYQYDANGNLISASDGTATTNPPTIQSVTPNVLFVGAQNNVTIAGQNLITTKSITASSSCLSIKILSVNNSQINAMISVASGCTDTSSSLTVTTLYGTASSTVTLSTSVLQFVPNRLVLSPGSTGGITASIAPSINQSVTLTINSSNPSVASAPSTITIPANGPVGFTVTASANGVTTISSGSTATVVSVASNYSTPAGQTSTSIANPVSVSIADATSIPGTFVATPLSVTIDDVPYKNAITVAPLVSVQISQ